MTGQVYVAGPQPGYQWLLADDDADYERVHAIATHRSRNEGWAPPPMHLLERDDDGTSLATADLPWLAGVTLALSERALSKVGPLLEPDGEFLPVGGAATGCHLFNCTAWSDSLDQSRSELARFSDGRIMRIKRVVLTADAFDRARVIRLEQTPRGPLYFSEDLIRRVDALGLTGTIFTASGSLSSIAR